MRAARASAVIALVLALLGLATPAHAEDEIGLSLDGVTWHDRLTEPLFAEPELWAPGHVETRSIWVRNKADEPGGLVVTVVHDDPHDAVALGHLVIEARVADGPWLPVVGGIAALDLVDVPLDAGHATRVDVRVTAPWESPNRSQSDVVPLHIVIGLAQAPGLEPVPGPEPGAGSGPEPGARGDLARTGATLAHGALWGGAVLVGAGAALFAARRHHRSGADRGPA